ncbi:MAG: 2-oxo acid dehydrogenase subunit E2 [Clostridia bacterium]|nr:2-oxo acid dehydrogenase subunit E2 [Clostridia bacterium]
MKPTKTIHFGIQRKIVANMTSESWFTTPHAGPVAEFDVTELLDAFNKLRASGRLQHKLSINTLMLKIIAEGLKAAPSLNAHITYDHRFVKGKIEQYDEIHFSIPMMLPNGEMMTINFHNFENKTLDEMSAYIDDVRRRLENTNLTEAMFEVSMDNTITALKHLKIGTVLGRLVGAKLGKYKIKTLSGKAKRDYLAIPEKDRITKRDIEQGTITVSNLGATDRGRVGHCSILEIIPPQVAVIALYAVTERPWVVTRENGEKEIAIRKILPVTVMFDHRACEYSDVIPLLNKIQEICSDPEQIMDW